MAGHLNIPDSLTKRDLLYGGNCEKEELSAYGDLFFEQRRYHDALMFYERAEDVKKLGLVRERALKDGDFHLLARINNIKEMEVRPEDWEEAARAALRGGKFRYAADMFERAGKEEEAAKARARFETPDKEKN